jgi:serine/threonine protein kinase
MSSGSLPEHNYHRASQLGAGTYGNVVVVYNDDGEEYALKLFIQQDNNGDEDSYKTPSPMEIGVIREISALRLLRDDNSHDNITKLVDIQTGWGNDDDEDEAGAGTNGCLSIALPLYKSGSLQDALEKGIFRSYSRKVKAAVAHGILSAVAFVSSWCCTLLSIKNFRSDTSQFPFFRPCFTAS